MNRLPTMLMKLAIWLLPPNRKDWGAAMMGEFELLDGADGAPFAMGCAKTAFNENFTASVGLARLAFLGLFVLAIGFAGIWLWSWTSILSAKNAFDLANLARMLWWLILGLSPVIIGATALDAMKAPTDRHYLASLGVRTTSDLAALLGSSMIVGTLGKVMGCHLTPRCAEVGGAMFLLGFYGVGLVLMGVASKRNARTLRNISSLAVSLTLALAVWFLWGPIELLLIDPFAIPMIVTVTTPPLLMALAGTLFTWMQRPSVIQ